MPHRHLLRASTAVVAGALTLTTVIGAAPAQAAPTASADAATDWLLGELTDGLIENEEFVGFTDYGLSVDVGLTMDQIGGRNAVVTEIRDALEPNVDSYTTGIDFESSDIYANAVAKLARYVQVSGGDPQAFGGVDLVTRLSQRVVKRGVARGRLADRTEFSDSANSIGQAFAVGALSRTDSSLAAPVTRFLINQQCRTGGFRLGLANGQDGRQRCASGSRLPSVDATALVVLELSRLPRADRTKATRSAVTRALAWLQGEQRNNGSFGSDSFIETSNTNSTGLASWALGINDRCRAARQAARWVLGFQVPGDATGPLAEEVGAIAYDRAGYDAGQADGIVATTSDQWRRASAQAAPALLFTRGC